MQRHNIILILLLLFCAINSSFSMKVMKSKLDERFKKIKKVNFRRIGRKAISPCGNYVALGDTNPFYDYQKKIQIWDLKNNKELLFYECYGAVQCVCFSQDGRYVASGDSTGIVEVWDIRKPEKILYYRDCTGKCFYDNMYRTEYTHNDSVTCLHLYGHCIASGSKDGVVKVLNMKNFNEIHYKHSGKIWSVCFSQDENYVVSGSRDGEVKVWDIEKKKEICCYEHGNFVFCVCFGPNGNYVASGSTRGDMKIWDIKKNKEVCFYHHNNGFISCICFSQDGNYIASGSKSLRFGGEVTIWDIKNNKKICSIKCKESFESINFGRGENYIAFGSGKKVIIWDVYKGTKVFFYDHIGWVKSLCFFNDYEKLLSVDDEGQVIIHEVSPKLYFNQKRYEIKKKYEKIGKEDEEERIGFIKHESQELGIFGSHFSMQLRNKKLNIYKAFLHS